MRLLEGTSVSGQVAPDSPDGKQCPIYNFVSSGFSRCCLAFF